MSHTKQHDLLNQLRRILPPSEPWERWLETSGELPPDFDTLPAADDLPDILAGIDSPAAWRDRREQLKTEFHQWIIGAVPPPPADLRAEILSETHQHGATVREVRLHFGDGAHLWLELLIPDGDGPFPVFMTQYNHRNWSQIALSRGYIACTYAGADLRDDTDTFLTAYPGYDWSRITRRAWAASRCLDYLQTEPRANPAQVAITGHSRNGKLSLIASALDERFALVISSSSGAGGVLSARYYSEQHFGEGIELITRRFPDWFHPRWRFFVGREQHLPVDLPDLVALSAPRPCLLSIALTDQVCSTWALEQTYHAVQPVYRLLDAEPNLRILWRFGNHETWPLVIERYLDWCDLHFGRGDYAFPERLLYPHDWAAWQARSGQTAAALSTPDQPLNVQIETLLGDAPPSVTAYAEKPGASPHHLRALLDHLPRPGVGMLSVDFGEHLTGDIFFPDSAGDKRLPALLWLPPYSPPKGYAALYRRGDQAVWALAAAGFAVFCFDPIGTGQRIEEAEHFYQRHPRWSLLGKTVRDARAALDAMQHLPMVDPERIFIVGYAFGSLVGLHLMALDDRPAGYAGAALPALSHLAAGDVPRSWRMFWPQLQLFAGQPLPYNTSDLLAACGARPALVISPQLDRETPLAAISSAVRLSGHPALTHLTPEAYNHFDPSMQALVIDWLRGQVE